MTYQNILVIKIGTSTLTRTTKDGRTVLDTTTFKTIAQQTSDLQQKGYGIVIVSSAAITAGMSHEGITQRPSKTSAMPELQRMASIGWRLILNTWAAAFSSHTIGELLITKRELDTAPERMELIRVIHQLLTHGNICVVNENDAIAHVEIAFGDNDTLAAHLAARLQQASLCDGSVKLVLLSDIQGVYADKYDPETLISTIDDIEALQHIAGGSESSYGTGGMTTKFLAAKIAQDAHVETWIGKGKQEAILHLLLEGKAGTRFVHASSEKALL